MKNLTTFSQLEVQFEINDFVEKTVSQINKDLIGLINQTIELAIEGDESRLEDLRDKLTLILKELDSSSQLKQYIYQVDLNEKKWMLFLDVQDFHNLSEQIIIREAQKVYLRQMFKKY